MQCFQMAKILCSSLQGLMAVKSVYCGAAMLSISILTKEGLNGLFTTFLGISFESGVCISRFQKTAKEEDRASTRWCNGTLHMQGSDYA